MSGWKRIGASNLREVMSLRVWMDMKHKTYRVRSSLSAPSQVAITLYSTSALSTQLRPLTPTTPNETLQHVGGNSSPCLPGRGISNEKGMCGRADPGVSGGLADLFDLTELLRASRRDVAVRGLLLSPVLNETEEEKKRCLYWSR